MLGRNVLCPPTFTRRRKTTRAISVTKPSSCRSFSTDRVLALHQPPVATRPDVAKADIVWHWAKQRDACADQYRHTRDHHPVDESGGDESLNRDAAIYISVFETAGVELLYDVGRFARRLLDHAAFDR